MSETPRTNAEQDASFEAHGKDDYSRMMRAYTLFRQLETELSTARSAAFADLLDEYERLTKLLPIQHEIKSNGCCTYNWRMTVLRDLRKLAIERAAPLPQTQQVVPVDGRCVAPPCKCDASNRNVCAYWHPTAAKASQ